MSDTSSDYCGLMMALELALVAIAVPVAFAAGMWVAIFVMGTIQRAVADGRPPMPPS